MALTALDLHNAVLVELGERANSNIGAMTDGVSSTQVVTTKQTNFNSFNTALDDIAETAFLLRTVGSLAFTSGLRTKDTSAATGLDTGVRQARAVLYATSVTWTPSGGSASVLNWCDEERLLDYDPDWYNSATGTPQYWFFPDGNLARIALYPAPATAGSVSFRGIGYPTLLVADTDTVPWLTDRQLRALVYYACRILCEKKMDDPNKAERIEYYRAEYDRLRVQMYQDQPADLAEVHLKGLPRVAVTGATKMRNAEGSDR